MEMKYFPSINPEATGRHIAELRKERGLSVKDLQNYFGFDAPQAIYKWQSGTTLPSVDNLLALSAILGVPMESILVTRKVSLSLLTDDEPVGSVFLRIFGVPHSERETGNSHRNAKHIIAAAISCISKTPRLLLGFEIQKAVSVYHRYSRICMTQ